MISPLPWQHEPIKVLANALAARRSALDASDTGVGKTFQALFAAKSANMRVAVVCPKNVIPAWKQAAEEIGVGVLFVLNVERLKRSKWVQKGHWVPLPSDVSLIIDEVHRFASPTTQNAKLLANAPRPVLMLSATAIQDPTKMRAIGSQLDLTNWNDWWHWCGRYGCKKGFFGGIEFKGTQSDLDKLHRQIFRAGRGVRVRVKDLGDQFPQNRIETRLLPVGDLKALDAAYIEELKEKEDGAPNGGVAMMRARQIAEHEMLGAVIEWVGDLIAEGNSVVVFLNFLESIHHFRVNFGNVSVIKGEQDGDEREHERLLFQNDENRLCVAMNQAGGVGIGLHDLRGEFPRVAIHLPGWSAVHFRQCLGRIPRAGAKSHCTQYVCFGDGSIGARNILPKLQKKLNNIDTINDGDMSV